MALKTSLIEFRSLQFDHKYHDQVKLLRALLGRDSGVEEAGVQMVALRKMRHYLALLSALFEISIVTSQGFMLAVSKRPCYTIIDIAFDAEKVISVFLKSPFPSDFQSHELESGKGFRKS